MATVGGSSTVDATAPSSRAVTIDKDSSRLSADHRGPRATVGDSFAACHASVPPAPRWGLTSVNEAPTQVVTGRVGATGRSLGRVPGPSVRHPRRGRRRGPERASGEATRPVSVVPPLALLPSLGPTYHVSWCLPLGGPQGVGKGASAQVGA